MKVDEGSAELLDTTAVADVDASVILTICSVLGESRRGEKGRGRKQHLGRQLRRFLLSTRAFECVGARAAAINTNTKPEIGKHTSGRLFTRQMALSSASNQKSNPRVPLFHFASFFAFALPLFTAFHHPPTNRVGSLEGTTGRASDHEALITALVVIGVVVQPRYIPVYNELDQASSRNADYGITRIIVVELYYRHKKLPCLYKVA